MTYINREILMDDGTSVWISITKDDVSPNGTFYIYDPRTGTNVRCETGDIAHDVISDIERYEAGYADITAQSTDQKDPRPFMKEQTIEPSPTTTDVELF